MAHVIYCPHFKAGMFCDECNLEFNCPVPKDVELKFEDVGFDKKEYNKHNKRFLTRRSVYGGDGINED